MAYELINELWEYSVLTAVLIWIVLSSRLLFGLVKQRKETIRTSIKYFINTLTFLFVYGVYFSFAIVVQAPHGKTKDDSTETLNHWVTKEALDWSLLGLLLTVSLILFNIFYQLKIENTKDSRQIVLLTILSVLIMTIWIFLGSYNAILGLTEEINRHTY